MQRSVRFLLLFVLLLLFSACENSESDLLNQNSNDTIDLSPTITSVSLLEETQITISVETTTPSEYDICGSGDLVQVGFFKDIYDNISPTQLIRIRNTADDVRRYASVVSCLTNDEGWVSDPDEVINGYENIIVFFDKYGKGHQYRIIVGGQYVEPWEEGRADIISSKKGMESGVDKQPYSVQNWIDATKEKFISTNTRQMGFDIYLDDTSGNLSSVFIQTYQFIETNHQIEQALLTGEGYPDDVPDGFFLFATESWLLDAE